MNWVSSFAWTVTGLTIHITDDAIATRCGRRAVRLAAADDVLWFDICKRCRKGAPELERSDLV